MLLYLLPFISALIGWLTNYIAVKMLFHPRQEINLFIFKVQGIFPKRQKELAVKLGDIVSQELFSIEDVKAQISVGSLDEDTVKLIDQHIENFLRNKLPEKMPMLQMFINDELINTIKDALLNEIKEFVPLLMKNYLAKIEAMDIKAIVSAKVEAFSSDKLEEILFTIMKKEFRFIEFLGGVLGFMIGIIQLILVRIFI